MSSRSCEDAWPAAASVTSLGAVRDGRKKQHNEALSRGAAHRISKHH